jgi:hypothetical protein
MQMLFVNITFLGRDTAGLPSGDRVYLRVGSF